MNVSKALEIGAIFVALMSITGLIGPNMFLSHSIVSNSSTAFTPSGGTQVAIGLAPYVGLLVSGLVLLGRLWKDRNWKQKYKGVIATEDFL